MDFSLDDLKSKGRKALRKSKLAKKQAAEILSTVADLSRSAKDLISESFRIDGLVMKFDGEENPKAAAEQRKLRDDRRQRADRNFRMADLKGAEAAELERKAFKLEQIALKIVEQVKHMEDEG